MKSSLGAIAISSTVTSLPHSDYKVYVGDKLEFNLSLSMSPIDTATSFHIELYSAFDLLTISAQLSIRDIYIGSNYNVARPIPIYTSSFGNCFQVT